jgi:Ser/Thr protein kinase RdoA (MazF antagonist)
MRPLVSTPSSQQAVTVAVEVARAHGLRVDEPRLLGNGMNVIVHLAPAPVVARIAAATAVVRPRPEDHLARDVAVAAHAAAKGAPVVAPSGELPPGPHLARGRVLSFWEYVEHDASFRPRLATVAATLKVLHDALADFDGDLQYLGPPLADLADVVDRLEAQGIVAAARAQRVREGIAACTAALPSAADDRGRALHGDAHARNTITGPDGLRWNDFEDTCRGPIEWDLACLVRRSGRAALRHYGDDAPTEAELRPFVLARRLQVAVWSRVANERDLGHLFLDGVQL